MAQTYKTVKKFRTPQTSKDGAYAINIYKNGNFFVSYLYNGWDKTAVDEELSFLIHRFPNYQNYTVEIG